MMLIYYERFHRHEETVETNAVAEIYAQTISLKQINKNKHSVTDASSAELTIKKIRLKLRKAKRTGKNAAQVSLICGGVSAEYLLKLEAVGRMMMSQKAHTSQSNLKL